MNRFIDLVRDFRFRLALVARRKIVMSWCNMTSSLNARQLVS